MISYKKMFHGFIWFLFLSFLVLYFAQAGGYYEDVNNKKASLTEEKIKQFEVENYVVNIKKNYDNKISSFGLYTSKALAEGFKWGMNGLFNGIDKMVNE